VGSESETIARVADDSAPEECEFGPLVERVAPRLYGPAGEGDTEVSSEGERTPAAVPRQAAVALILRENAGQAELLVIKRAEQERDHWSGHLALPGGRRDPEDMDLQSTAIRETFEEVGIDLSDAEGGASVLGGLDVVRPQSPRVPPIEVWPFVAIAPRAYHLPEGGPPPRELVFSREVAAAFWMPVAVLMQSGRSDAYRMVFDGRKLKWPAYPSEHGPIWGITEKILTNFLRLAS
jgi:8-oxo-dGTP pyrophosphatase MutT (NUDIX family)